MRILIVNNFARVTGGADRHCLDLSDGLIRRGHEVALLATAHRENVVRSGAFVPLMVTNATRDHLGARASAQAATMALWNRQAASAMHRLIADFRPDVVHLHKLYVQLSVSPVVVASSWNLPIVQTVHDYEFTAADWTDATGGRVSLAEGRVAFGLLNSLTYLARRHVHRPRVDAWIAVSRAVSAIYKQSGIDTLVLPNFTSAPVADSPRPFEARRGLLFAGRLSPEKGIADLLELAGRAPELPVMIAGAGPLRTTVERAAQTGANLTYLGNLTAREVVDQMRMARFVVMPSLWSEPGPLAALEAMAQGTPIIAYANGGLGEYVSDARAGLVIAPTADALVATARGAYDDHAGWTRLAAGGLRAAGSTHTVDRYLDQLLALYSRILAPSGPPSTRSAELDAAESQA